MRLPSRFMPKYVRKKLNILSLILILVLAISIISLIVLKPKIVFAIFLIFVLVFCFGCFFEKPKLEKHFKHLYDSRKSLTIGDFAREFDCHEVDTWIIRATYEQLQNALAFNKMLPIKSSDRLKEDLLLDDDDLDLDIAVEISQRTGRDLENLKNNPYFGKVITVRDLVLFFNYQSKN